MALSAVLGVSGTRPYLLISSTYVLVFTNYGFLDDPVIYLGTILATRARSFPACKSLALSYQKLEL